MTRRYASAVSWFRPKTIAILREGIAETRAHGDGTAKFHANWLETALDAIEHLKRRPKRRAARRAA